jgi:hypothetical protein
MLFMAMAVLEAYPHRDYVLPHPLPNRTASLLDVLRDVFQIFKIEMRLVKPASGFATSCDVAETELLTLDSMKNTTRHHLRLRDDSLSRSFIEYYF